MEIWIHVFACTEDFLIYDTAQSLGFTNIN